MRRTVSRVASSIRSSSVIFSSKGLRVSSSTDLARRPPSQAMPIFERVRAWPSSSWISRANDHAFLFADIVTLGGELSQLEL
jgi:hypothetical protein